MKDTYSLELLAKAEERYQSKLAKVTSLLEETLGQLATADEKNSAEVYKLQSTVAKYKTELETAYDLIAKLSEKQSAEKVTAKSPSLAFFSDKPNWMNKPKVVASQASAEGDAPSNTTAAPAA